MAEEPDLTGHLEGNVAMSAVLDTDPARRAARIAATAIHRHMTSMAEDELYAWAEMIRAMPQGDRLAALRDVIAANATEPIPSDIDALDAWAASDL